MIHTTWELWTYDVWGNAEEGFEVNDRSCFDRDYPIDIKPTLNNPSKASVFTSAYPTDYQIRKAFGVNCKIELDGDDMTIYVNRERDNYPIGEMFCTSHASLSPVRAKEANNGAI